MPNVTGWISVELDVSDYESDVSVEFDSLDDMIRIAEDQSYFFSDIVEYFLDRDTSDALNDLVDVMRDEDVLELFKRKFDRQLILKDNRIESLSKELDNLQKLHAALADRYAQDVKPSDDFDPLP